MAAEKDIPNIQLITIDEASGVPLWLQLRNRIIYLIGIGRLRPGDQLPTVRELSVSLGVNLNTVNKVYRDVERDGYIVSKRGKGTFVAADAAARSGNSDGIDLLIDDFVRKCADMGVPEGDIPDLVGKRIAARRLAEA